MNSIAIPRRGLSPLSVGLILAFLLFFVIVAIVRSVTAPTQQISAATSAGVASVQVPQAQSNVSNALPAFSMQPQTQPAGLQPSETSFVSDAPVQFMTAEEEDAFNNHEWLAVTYDRGIKNVYGGAWFPCRHIDADLLTYNTVRTDPALTVWAKMAPSDQNEIAKECAKP